MNKIKVAIVGYGNIGRFALDAVQAAPDMELMGIVRRASSIATAPNELNGIQVVSNIDELGKVDVAILCGPTRSIPETALALVKKGICTVDSFDIHGEALWNLRQSLDEAGKESKVASIISAGWDPGSDSVIRTLLLAMAPKGITYTNFGPGMSMGHSVVARSKEGVKNALSMTIPTGTGVHRRMVYVELDKGASLANVTEAIKADSYFSKDETHVMEVADVDNLQDMGHGVLIERKGVSGKTQNQLFQFSMQINNPALTAQILISCARAVTRQAFGAYTMPEIAPLDYLFGDKEMLIKTLV
ncbi:MAG: diaminopimelate dehydrogenase [Paludibacteraceae bacterium]|nr:diaminopimelate dehydrogenase [Paludibacteraceae bacterium]MBP6284563.1 diaminopimelate dehydrogenase [Paludibacteraceae bacterium]